MTKGDTIGKPGSFCSKAQSWDSWQTRVGAEDKTVVTCR